MFSQEETFCNFGRDYYEKHFCEIMQEEMSFTDISILAVLVIFSAERFFCSFNRGHYE